MKFPRPSPSVFAYCKRLKTGGIEGLGTRLHCTVPSNQVAEFKHIMLIKNVLTKQWCLEKALDVAGGRMKYE